MPGGYHSSTKPGSAQLEVPIRRRPAISSSRYRPPMIRLYTIPFSTNVERISLALAHKGLEAEEVPVDPADRSVLVELSGQDLVPVIDDGGEIVADSPLILAYLEM